MSHSFEGPILLDSSLQSKIQTSVYDIPGINISTPPSTLTTLFFSEIIPLVS